MAHAIWKGSVNFGLVNIPVNLYSGENRSEELSFSMLDKRDMSPIGYKKVNKVTGEEVPRDAQIKAYEYQEGQWVTITEADLKRASPERTQRVDITAFVDASEIDPAYFDKPYYLEPAARSEKVYALLREALVRTKKIGIATVVIRSKEYLAALIPHEKLLLLNVMRWPHELRDPNELKLPERDLKKLKISEAELKMAERLVEDLGAGWDPTQFKDQYHDELLAFIQKKAEKGEAAAIAEAPKAEKKEAPADIMALLKASVAHAQTGKGKAPAPRGRMLH